MTDVLPGMPGFYGGPAQAAAARDALPPPRAESPSCSGGSFDSDVAFVACVLDKRGCVDQKKAARALEAAAEAAGADSCGAADCCDSAVDLADDGVAALQRLNEMHRELERFPPVRARATSRGSQPSAVAAPACRAAPLAAHRDALRRSALHGRASHAWARAALARRCLRGAFKRFSARPLARTDALCLTPVHRAACRI